MANQMVDPATEIYEVAQKEMQVKLDRMVEESESEKKEIYSEGVLDAFESVQASTELQYYAALFRVKKDKEYKKGGKTWKQFCEGRGLDVRNTDRILSDIGPLLQAFSDKFTRISGVGFNKIRQLGRLVGDSLSEISENGIQVSDEEIIPLDADHKEEIEAYINTLKRAEKDAKEEREKDLAAKQRVIKTLHETINNQEEKLSKYEKSKPGPDSALDAEQLKGLKDLKNQFELFFVGMGLGVNLYLYKASDRVQTEYFSTITYARQMIERLWEDAGNDLGFPVLPGTGADDDGWEPPEWNESESDE
ncbi:hypothetical protein [uncultured Desulfobacter sp.]|uniref:hypothetical protein n=1 Tax=uncultured Desulfobacter sp. TaxID=240139 RepID=UPI002AABBA59|nr:hypothetical protein [uncultured Desulfobacter sp.]